MTTYSSVNNLTLHGAHFVYSIKNTLSSSGWTVLKSSNGAVTGSNNQDTWTSLSAATSSYAWTILKSPVSNHHVTFQKSASDGSPYYIYWTVKMLSGAVDLSSGNATTLPTEASGTYRTFLNNSFVYGSYTEPLRHYVVAQSTGEWWAAVVRRNYGHVDTFMMFDKILNVKEGDVDNFAMGYRAASGQQADAHDLFLFYTSLSGSWASWTSDILRAETTTIGTNYLTKKPEIFPPYLIRNIQNGDPQGIKGTLSTMKYGSHPALRKIGTILNASGEKSHICLSNGYNVGTLTTVVPWDGVSDFLL